jgi:phospholipid/cholesterol/gamma-HCH transport system permease protein
MILRPFYYLGNEVIRFIRELGGILLMFLRAVRLSFTPPYRFHNLIKQMEFVGVKSLFIVVLTGLFSGMVLALQSYHGFRKFGGETLMGGLVALSLTREMGPVMTALMVNARAGSAIAAELGTMRVTEGRPSPPNWAPCGSPSRSTPCRSWPSIPSITWWYPASGPAFSWFPCSRP